MASLQGTTVNNYLRTLEQVRATGWYGTPTGTSYTGLAAELGMSAGEAYLLCYNRDTPGYGVLNIAGSASNLRISGSVFNLQTGALQQGGNQVLHAGNVATYALPIGGGTLTGGLTVTNLFGNANSASLYANTGDYGSWKIGGTRNGWYGIEFESGVSLMVNSTEVGFHRNGYGWQMRWSVGTGYIHKGSNGGGTQATILDSSNVATYALPIGGGTLTGALNGTTASFSGNVRVSTISAANHGLTCVYYGGGTAPTNGYLITTNIDYSTFNMPTVIIEGYAYGSTQPIHLEIVWYAYSNSWTSHAYTNLGAWDPGTISIGTNASGKVCLHLSAVIYYGRFNVRCIYDQGNAALEGWTVSDATTAALTRVTTIPKSAIVTSITGNAATVTNGLTTGNYNSYALPLTGGTVSGLVRINNQLQVGQNTNGTAYIDAYGGYAWFGRDSNTTGIRIDGSANVHMTNALNVVNAITQNGNQVLNASNYVGYSAFTGSVSSGGNITATGYINASSYVYSATYLQTGGNLIYPAGLTSTQRLEVGNASGNGWIDGLTIAQGGNVTVYNNLTVNNAATIANDLSITGQYQIRNSEPTITLRDTDHRTAFIHVNSNIFYILTGGVDAARTAWGQVANSRWPLEINLSNNNASFGADVNAISFTGSGSGLTGTATSLSIGGAAASATFLNSSNYIQRIGGSGNYNTDFQNTPAGSVRHQGDDASSTNNPGAAWWFVDNYRHSNSSNYWGTQVAWGWEDNANRLATRNVTSNSFGAWVYYLNSGNYSSYAIARGGDTLDGIIYFRSNKGATSTVGASNTYSLEAYSSDAGAAGMSFHRGGYYAVNMGLDPDNVLRIGGWSASANRWQLDMSGNQTLAGNLTAVGGVFSGGVSITGNVGIGVATPLYKLDVSGTIRFAGLTTGTSTNVLVIEANGEIRTKVNAASSGSSGSSGANGGAGGAGPPGPPGPPGGAGSSGSAGAAGSPGPPGPPGGTGTSGSAGAAGSPGPPGPPGGTGSAGSPGPPGGTGPAGSANASGTTGKMAKFTAGTTLGDSNITVTGTGIQLPSTPASATPSDLDFNTSYANTAGAPSKQMIKLYYDGASCYGFGVSGGQLEMMAYVGGIHAFYNGGTLVGQFNSNGNLGVGVTPSSYKLDVNGNVHAVGFPTSSDIRFKKNIRPIENALSKVLKLRGVKYEWNEFINNTRDGYDLNSPIIGFIAQELELVVPELVSKWKLNEECQDARAVDYPRVVVLLTEAIKEQQIQINGLKNRITVLENK